MLPVSLLEPLRKHLTYVSSIHVRDLREGFGQVNLPYALAKKYPRANKAGAGSLFFQRLNVAAILARTRFTDTTLANGFSKRLLRTH